MGIPYNLINNTALRMYKSLGYEDSQITIALGSIGIAWSLKPLWAAFLDMYRTKKFFVLSMEVLFAALLVGVAMSLPAPGFFQISIALFWVGAFASSTQDICADGLYLTALDKPGQARFAGLQGTFWVLGKILVTGLLITSLDKIRLQRGWNETQLWQAVMVIAAATMLFLAVWHFFILPAGKPAQRPESARQVARDFISSGTSFFHKRAFWGMIAFVFLYRLGEGLILMEGQLFLQSAQAKGGLGLTAAEVSHVEAFWGTLFGLCGGLLGGLFCSRLGLSRSLWILGLCLNVPHFTYVYLSQAASDLHGTSYATIVTMVSIEKFGYGFGFVGNMIYMMQQLAPGRTSMTHYAFATALMNLILVPTSMISGPLAEWLGFKTFFIVVMFASIPSVWAAFKAPFPHSATGKSDDETAARLDDPNFLSAAARPIQRLAGRASMFAMLHILVLLIVDAQILGSLHGKDEGPHHWQVGLLIASALLKLDLSRRALRFAREARAEALATNETVYVQNARGAKITTIICVLFSTALLVIGLKLAL